MSPAAAPPLVAGIEIKINGQTVDPSVRACLLEARVQDNLMAPDAFMVRFRDPDFKLVDGTLFQVGAKIELQFSADDERAPGDPFKGEVATIAPQFEREGCVLVARGYDVSHKLNRSRNTRTFQDMTASDIAKKVIGEAGLTADVEATSDVYPFEQQSSETDWHYLWRLAERVSYEITCSDEKIHFRKPGGASGSPVQLKWGESLLTFHPRATAVAQVEKVTVSGWDPKAKRRVTADAQTPKLDSKIGLQRAKVSGDLGGGTLSVADRIVTSQGEATALAQSTLDRLANAWLEADGTCRGNPKVRAGAKVKVDGVGQRFGGEYVVTKSTHVIRGSKGYETEFEISGRNRRTLVDILTPAPRDDYATSLVIGVVTNNDDPDKMGRVRVKFPGLDEQKEGWWARIASMSATGNRGVLMMPLVDDEVVVGFEHGDPRRPFVLGSLWNGTSKPAELAAKGGAKPDGSFRVHSDKELSLWSKEYLSVVNDEKMQVKSKFDMEVKSTEGNITITCDRGDISVKSKGGSVVVKMDGSITVKGTQITVDAQAKLALTSSGVVQIKGSQVMIG